MFLDIKNIKYAYESIANELNKKEYEFRVKIRKTLCPNWKIHKLRKHKWHTPGGVYVLNITSYYENITKNKKRYFTYYHCRKEEINIFKYKYDDALIKEYILRLHANCSYKNYDNLPFVYLQTIKYRMLKSDFNNYLTNQRTVLFENFKTQFNENNYQKLNIEVDDTYTKIQNKQTKNKICCRVIAIHPCTKNIKNSPKIMLVNLSNTNENEGKTSKEIIANRINNILESLNFNNKLVLIGDGARWMKTLKNQLNCDYVLDKFHIKLAIKKNFSMWKGSYKEHKKLFKTWKCSLKNKSWYAVFCDVFNEKSSKKDYEVIKNNFLKEMDWYVFNPEIKQRFVDFFKYIDANKNGIWNGDESLNKQSSYTEHFINHYLKTHIKKRYSVFSLATLKQKIEFNNLQKQCLTFFI
ncbi:Mbov_0401 family ICE element transposase-like protein [Ureaplasma parvum]|uniref:Mbov_0401 family ICE element transposase-like protein n=1 Tax=Ureaplasma parvum TaxID=134821 RepID=UPI0026EF99C6|nr:hypothetical protein [Ureaplasma parvum]